MLQALKFWPDGIDRKKTYRTNCVFINRENLGLSRNNIVLDHSYHQMGELKGIAVDYSIALLPMNSSEIIRWMGKE